MLIGEDDVVGVGQMPARSENGTFEVAVLTAIIVYGYVCGRNGRNAGQVKRGSRGISDSNNFIRYERIVCSRVKGRGIPDGGGAVRENVRKDAFEEAAVRILSHAIS